MNIMGTIHDILTKNGVRYAQISCFGDFDNLSHVDIEIVDMAKNKAKWEYFIKKVCDEESGIETFPHTTSNIVKYKFKIPFKSLNKFLDGINRKYHTVSPKVKKFAVLIKPTHMCNMGCLYCYEWPLRHKYGTTVMSMEILDKIFRLLSDYTEELQVIWHGGEPTMAGKEWFIQAYNQVISKYPMIDMNFHLMSNGINLVKDEEWLDLFNYYDIRPGISYNAYYQRYLRPSETSYDLKELVEKARKRGVSFGVIDVISQQNYKHLKEIYEFYKSIKINPCFNQIFFTPEADKNGLMPNIEDFTRKYIEYFHYWLWDKNGIFERAAAEALAMVLNGEGLTCRHNECRFKWLGFFANGDVYPCDHYYPDRYYLGNITNYESIEEIFNSEPYKNFVSEIEARYKNYCSKCYASNGCHGGCHGATIEAAGSAAKVDANYCYFTRELYKAVYNEIREIIFYKDRDRLNPHALAMMKGYYSIKEIKELLGFDINMSHNPDNLDESEEFKVFTAINHQGKRQCGIHIDFIEALDESQKDTVIEINVEKRKRDLMEFLRGVVKSAIPDSRKAC